MKRNPPPEPLTTRLREALGRPERLAVLGVGAELRGDDIAGVLVARGIERLAKRRRNPRIAGFPGCAAPENMTGAVAQFRPTHLVLVDAAELGQPPGSVEVIPPDRIGGVSFSTHTLPAPIILDYIKKSVGCEVLVVGIQPKDTGMLVEPAPVVLAAVEQVVAALDAASQR